MERNVEIWLKCCDDENCSSGPIKTKQVTGSNNFLPATMSTLLSRVGASLTTPHRFLTPASILACLVLFNGIAYWYGTRRRPWEVREDWDDEEHDEDEVEGGGGIRIGKEEWKDGVAGLVGHTPIIEIKSLSALFPGVRIFGKCEFLNPGGSIKDRVALRVLQRAIEEGTLIPNVEGSQRPRAIVFEGTSGSTDIGQDKVQTLRRLGATLEIVKPTSIVDENHYVNVARKRADEYRKTGTLPVLPALSVGIAVNESAVLSTSSSYAHVFEPQTGSSSLSDSPTSSPKQDGLLSQLRDIGEELFGDDDESRLPGEGCALFMDQFENLENYKVHLEESGPEIWSQMKGEIDCFVSGMGTGGTMAGIGKYLKSKKKNIHVVLADPQGSGLYNKVKHGVLYADTEAEGTRRRHQIDSVIFLASSTSNSSQCPMQIVEGIGLNRSTHNMRLALPNIDDAVRVSDHEAVVMSRHLLKQDGLFVGSSSAVNLVAAMRVARQWSAQGKEGNIVTVLCDSGSRHFKRFWNDDLVGERGIQIQDTIQDIMDDPEA
ncbi:tryptophan synthase beta subunit-like PLP-dependent enzyme [Atractiella rhizophila]|nr:tryptophan synthase beta subunit-like PLP-dependent enzyme [Atractiella rhizophila]